VIEAAERIAPPSPPLGAPGGGLLRPTEALTRFAPALPVGPLREFERAPQALRYGFRCSRLGLLVPSGVASEALEPTRMAPVPHAPAWLVGMMNLRGHPVPVFDLCVALALPRDDGSQRTMVLVLGKGERAVGLLIDGLPRALAQVQAVAVPTGLPQRLAPFARQGWLDGAQLWIEFDDEAFFSCLGGGG
jgi:chemotaxis signal transduction protein